MGSLPEPELSLDFRPAYLPKTITDILNEVSLIGNDSDKASKLDAFVLGLEDELKKIDAFKRELPLCMLLLNDAILYLKSEVNQCAAANNTPVLEEFIPLKKNCDDDDEQEGTIKVEKDCKDKKNWMSSVQLWNTSTNNSSSDCVSEPKQNLKLESKTVKKWNHPYASDDVYPACKSRSAARGSMPFIKNYSGLSRKEDINNNNSEELPVPGLSLLTPGINNLREESSSLGSKAGCRRAVSSSSPIPQSSLTNGLQLPHQQTSRKQRRCWSPELHRRFVNALQQLGGSQVATPKQIRELMQVDGLTNDEVKSHLQKYRLHSRRLPSGTAAPADQSVVVLGGGLWMSQEQYNDDLKATSSESGSPQGPLQLGGNSTTGGDSMEDDEDAKSEGYSWKNHIHRSAKVAV